MTNLQNLRNEIDKVDKSIGDLLLKRMELVKEIGKIKEKGDISIVDTEREIDILSRFEEKYVKEVFKKILSESKKLQ